MPECSLVRNLIPCFLTFCSTRPIEFNPYLPFKFLIFYHSSSYTYAVAIAIMRNTSISKIKTLNFYDLNALFA